MIDAETSSAMAVPAAWSLPHLIGRRTAQIVLRISTAKGRQRFPSPSANSSSRCSTGVNSNASDQREQAASG